MYVTGLTYPEFEEVFNRVNIQHYNGNLAIKDWSMVSSRTFRVVLRTIDSHGAGTRTSWTGRYGPWVCWHAFRDVIGSVFTEYPHAKIRTGMANYDGLSGFETNYPATGERNIGSMIQPAYMPDMCDCHDYAAYDTWYVTQNEHHEPVHKSKEVIGKCFQCGTPLYMDDDSMYFCSDRCQYGWYAKYSMEEMPDSGHGRSEDTNEDTYTYDTSLSGSWDSVGVHFEPLE